MLQMQNVVGLIHIVTSGDAPQSGTIYLWNTQ